MLTASCHRGAVRVTVARRPPSITGCNGSICRHHGTLDFEPDALGAARIRRLDGASSWTCVD